MTATYPDSTGLRFDQLREKLGPRENWPLAEPVRLNGKRYWDLISQLHERWLRCAVCCAATNIGPYDFRAIEIHHIFPGARKSDEVCCLMPLCVRWGRDGCHDKVSSIGLPRLLYARYVLEPETVDWWRMSIVRGSFLPDLEPFEIRVAA